MQLQDGFIVGIHNYCDRWCEACAFTSYCRVFAMSAHVDALLDPHLRAVAEAPPLPEETASTLPRGMPDLADALEEAASLAADHPDEGRRARAMPAAHDDLRARAEAYRAHVSRWLDRCCDVPGTRPDDPLAVIAWFHTLIPAKVEGALASLESAREWEEPTSPDADGCAKVVLLGISRSQWAWLALVQACVLSMAEAVRMVTELVRLAERVERLFPRAWAFTRPAFDEPAAVAALRAAEGRTS